MADLSDELVDAAKQILVLVESEHRLMGNGEVPKPPDIPDIKKELEQLHYKGLIDEAAERLQAAIDEQVAARKLMDDRENTAQANNFEREKAATAAQVAITAAAQAVTDSRVDSDIAAEVALVQAVHDAYLAVAQSAIDRAMKRAEFITGAVTAITTLYTGLLGLAYGLGAGNKPLPARGIIPALFLGASLVLAAVYMTYIRGYSKARQLLPTGSGGALPQERLVTFFDWTFSGVLRRAWALRLSVVSLAVGLALLPIPFVDISGKMLTLLVAIAGGVIVIAGVIEGVHWFRQSAKTAPGSEVPGPLAVR